LAASSRVISTSVVHSEVKLSFSVKSSKYIYWS